MDELSATEKKNITAIRLTSTVVASDDKLSYSAVNGTITLTPSDNVKDDKYTLWLGRNYYSDASDKPAGNQPWPDVAKVVAGSISGTVWWDKDENTLIGDGEEHIEGVEVTLGKQDSSGGWQTVKTVKTDKDGHYEFDLLHSGTYRTSVKRNTGTSTGDGVQTQVKTYYNKLEDVVNTRSWSDKIKSNAKDTSDDIHLASAQTRRTWITVTRNQTRKPPWTKPSPAPVALIRNALSTGMSKYRILALVVLTRPVSFLTV
mgnify:FL=1